MEEKSSLVEYRTPEEKGLEDLEARKCHSSYVTWVLSPRWVLRYG